VTDEPRRALLTGLTGQDGSFLAELLVTKNYEVTALIRRALGEKLGLVEHLRGRIRLVTGDLLSPETLTAAVRGVRPRPRFRRSPARPRRCWRP
jgi:GDPmannose 4,6-dehydratase